MATDRLYTPWRMNYVTSSQKQSGCVFCAIINDDVKQDRENYLLYRGQATFAVMNIYPYTVGHLMILPHHHISTLTQLSSTAQIEMMVITTYFTELLTELMQPDGFNIGINIGRAAGAGIDSHLHTHLVPRWNGDSNFMPVTGSTRVLPEMLEDTFDKIRAKLIECPPLKIAS